MALAPGTRLGPYVISAPLGAGGMGEVYKATDTRLDRTVAIKVLPEHVASDPDFKQRFEREAKTLAALSHSHICPVFDVGSQNHIDFLVMEYLEGETLEQRLKKGALPLAQALQIGVQIAEALATAHRAGIIHRDLKPGNVMLTKSGVKLLDFGLAKLHPTSAVTGLSLAATVGSPLTGQGTILGTLHYMSPEQVEGKDADGRSDIFAFGAVVYEMVTGKKAFEGKSAASVIAAILEREPPAMSTLQPVAPPALDHVVSRCLAKDPEERWQSAGDVMRELTWIVAAPRADAAMAAKSRYGRRERLAWALLAAAVLAVVLLAVPMIVDVGRAVPLPAPLRVEATIGADASIVGQSASLAVSPDGTLLVVAAGESQGPRLYLRRLGELRANPLAGTANARDPFFSPDSQWIGFFADGKLKKIAVRGGAPVTVTDAANDRGGAWAEDGSIVFQPNTNGSGLWRLSSGGGAPTPVTKLGAGEFTHRWPQVLPGGKAVLYTVHNSATSFDDATIVVQPLPDGTPKIVQRGGYYGRYLPSGHLVFVREETLFAEAFDLARLEPTSQPVPVIEGISAYPGLGGAFGFQLAGSAQVAWTEAGTAVYVAGQDVGDEAPLQWMNRLGEVTALRATPATWSDPAFSPDGRRLALDVESGQADVFVYDWARDTLTRTTFDANLDVKPVWTPDGQRLVFRSSRDNRLNLYWQRADGSGDVQRLTESENSQFPASWHPSGKYLAFFETRAQTGNDLMILPIEGDEASGWKPGKPIVFLSTPFNDGEPMFSPDGRWIAYQSGESGRFEVYVRPFPGPGGKWQVSTEGGVYPTWSRTRREIVYAGPDNRLMVASYTVEGESFKADQPRVWSERRFMPRRLRSFDLHPDGERVVLAVAPESESTPKQDKVVFIFNFFEELRRILPVTPR